jgi:hypothetical protein
MRRAAALITLLLALSGCSSVWKEKAWESGAVLATGADIASTQAALRAGHREGNPLYGEHPSVGKMVIVNAALLAVVKASLRDASEVQRRRAWRWIAIARFAAAAWNLSRL